MSRIANYLSLKSKNVRNPWLKTETVPYSLSEKLALFFIASLVSFAITTMVQDVVTAKYKELNERLQHHQAQANKLEKNNKSLKSKVDHYEAVIVSILNEKPITVGYSKMQFKRVKASDDCKKFVNC